MDFELRFLNVFVIHKNYVSLQIGDFYISTSEMNVLDEVFVESLIAKYF